MYMHRLLPLLFFLATPLFATHVLFDTDELDADKKALIFDLIMVHEPPRSLPCIDLEQMAHLEWIAPTAWQIGVLHAFFHDPAIRETILASAELEPLTYDAAVHRCLPHAENIGEIQRLFDAESQTLPNLSTLFFQINKSIAELYERAERSDLEMVRLALSELPPFVEWRERGFPFWNSPWIYNQNSAAIFYSALMDEKLLSKVIEIEHLAHEQGEWVLYRGYSGSGYPTTLQAGGNGSHALSFGSTLLGGTFFSLEASALTYAEPHTDQGEWSFLALRVTLDEMQELFRVGPLHPFLQLLVDGEMFHAHTKIAAVTSADFRTKPLDGYFMACNRHCLDPIGYILALKMTPQELEEKFQTLCQKSGTILKNQDANL